MFKSKQSKTEPVEPTTPVAVAGLLREMDCGSLAKLRSLRSNSSESEDSPEAEIPRQSWTEQVYGHKSDVSDTVAIQHMCQSSRGGLSFCRLRCSE
jgi:hypothetical protein